MEQVKKIYPKMSDKTVDGTVRQVIQSKDGTRVGVKIKSGKEILIEWFNSGFIPELNLGDEITISYEIRIAGVTGYTSNGEWLIHGADAIANGTKLVGDSYESVSDVTVFNQTTVDFNVRKRNLLDITEDEAKRLNKLGVNIAL